MKVKKVSQIPEQGKCGVCKNFFRGLCIVSLKARHPNQPCNTGKFEKGSREELSTEELEKVVAKFHELNSEKQIIEWDLNILRNAILESLDGRRVIGRYFVNISTVKQKRLNTKKVKELVDSMPNKDDFYTEIEYKRLVTKVVK